MAVLVPPPKEKRGSTREVVEELREFRGGSTLDGLKIKDLIEGEDVFSAFRTGRFGCRSLGFRDEDSTYADRTPGLFDTDTAVAPAVWPLEVANAILMGERRGRLSAADTARFTELLGGPPVAVEDAALSGTIGVVLNVGREYGPTSHDAAYLKPAMRRGPPLATPDGRGTRGVARL